MVEGTEALIISVFASSSSSSTPHRKRKSFQLDQNQYVIEPTRGQGACLLHALLGECVEGLYRFPGDNKSSSVRAKTYYLNTLKTQLKNSSKIRELFGEVIKPYLDESIKDKSSDPCALMLFAGHSISKEWADLKQKFSSTCLTIRDQEAKAWLPLIQVEKSPLLDQIMVAVRACKNPKEPFFQKRPEETLSLLVENPTHILKFINQSPDDFISLLSSGDRSKILPLREALKNTNEAQTVLEAKFILGEDILGRYAKVVQNPAFYLNTNETRLCAHLFNMKVQVVTDEGQETEFLMNEDAPGELVVIHHKGAHFSRCVILSTTSKEQEVLEEKSSPSKHARDKSCASTPIRKKQKTSPEKKSIKKSPSSSSKKKAKAPRSFCFDAWKIPTKKSRST